MRRTRISIITAAAIALNGGLFPHVAQAQSGVQDATVDIVENCKLLGPVTESRYSGFLFTRSGVRKAKQKVRQTLGAMGATHVVWGAKTTGVTQSVTGVGYRCK